MSLAIQPLPEDPDALRRLASDLQAELARKDIEITARDAEIYAKTLHIEKLKMQLAVLRRARFGRSSEKLDRDIEQLELLIGELEEEAAEEEARAGGADPGPADPDGEKLPNRRTRPRKRPGRAKLPEHLPRETVTHEPACTCPGCGGTVFSRVGQDERELLEYIPASFKVIQHIRPKLSCRACETIVQAPMPSLPIERGLPGPGLLAHIAISKFCDHLPLHRQSAIYAREGGRRARSRADGRLDGQGGVPAHPARRGDRPPHPRRRGAARRRHHRAGALAGAGQDGDRAAVGGGPRRAAVGFARPACRVLSLLPGSQGRPCRGAARRLPRLSAC